VSGGLGAGAANPTLRRQVGDSAHRLASPAIGEDHARAGERVVADAIARVQAPRFVKALVRVRVSAHRTFLVETLEILLAAWERNRLGQRAGR
jgi:hypothetical protein